MVQSLPVQSSSFSIYTLALNVREYSYKMSSYLWRTISQGYRDSLEKDISTRQQLIKLHDMCKYGNYQNKSILESDIKILLKGPMGQSHEK